MIAVERYQQRRWTSSACTFPTWHFGDTRSPLVSTAHVVYTPAVARSTPNQMWMQWLQISCGRGITTHFARPRTPNDNPQIESLFSTVKCAPAYPERFRTVDEAQKYFDEFFRWYNVEHYHTRLGMIRPADVHSGRADLIRKERARIRARTMEARRRFNCRAA